jgi:hypothetical protein
MRGEGHPRENRGKSIGRNKMTKLGGPTLRRTSERVSPHALVGHIVIVGLEEKNFGSSQLNLQSAKEPSTPGSREER